MKLSQYKKLIVAGRQSLIKAFTLLELVVTITIIAVLATLSIPGFKSQRNKAETVVCMSHMRGLHVAFDSYMIDKNHWPQMPEAIFLSDNDSDFWRWWILTMTPYGGDETFWLCPSDKVMKESKDEYNGSYLPTRFDAKHHTPYRWANQPWLLERGNLHKKGAHILMLDGSIHSSQDVF
ncbi:MAG: type II secretion system GspH family protein [Verrucomicrobiales bacterium]|nr:type II secretion system GspH family protein [Verrucomicrobiales bacterium]